MPNPHEVAILRVGGVEFHDWESVYVQHRWQEGWPTFRFTAAEAVDLPFDYRKLQFKPGDPCTIILGGQLAVTGIITQRQVGYTATEHGVQLSGVGKQWAASTSSILSEKNKNNFDGMTAVAAGMKAVTDAGGSFAVIGMVDPTKFDRLQSQPGELVWDFLDKVARMRNATLGSDHLGNLLMIGEHSMPIVQQLTEGENILKMTCIFSNELMYSLYKLHGQYAVGDNRFGAAVNAIVARANGGLKGLQRFKEIVLEQPAKNAAEAQMRANYEALRADGTQIRCNVTVQGWLRDGKQLWRTGDNVTIYSPMCPLNLGMKIQTATFTQDSRSGTTTVLECVLPWMLGDKLYALASPPDAANNTAPPDPTTST